MQYLKKKKKYKTFKSFEKKIFLLKMFVMYKNVSEALIFLHIKKKDLNKET